jgi:hypothetical protein
MDQHDAGEAAVDTVEQPDVDGIEPVRRRADEAVDVAFRAAPNVDRRNIGTTQRLVIGIFVVAMAGDLGGDDAINLLEAAVIGERGVATEHAAGMGVHHAPANRIVDLKTNLVKTLQQKSRPLKRFPIGISADRRSGKWSWDGTICSMRRMLHADSGGKKRPA